MLINGKYRFLGKFWSPPTMAANPHVLDYYLLRRVR